MKYQKYLVCLVTLQVITVLLFGAAFTYFDRDIEYVPIMVRALVVGMFVAITTSAIIIWFIKSKRMFEMIGLDQYTRRTFEDNETFVSHGYDENRVITFWNKGSEKLFGITADQAIGRKIEDLIIFEADREQVIEIVNWWIKNGHPQDKRLDFELKGPDAQPLYISTHFREFPVTPEGYRCYFCGINQTKQKTELLRVWKELKKHRQ